MTIETFNLVRERCLLSNLNVRTEKHGDENEPALDLAFSFSGANNLLLKLHPGLRDTFYSADETKDIDPDHKPHLRFPLMGPITWDLEIPRTRLCIHDPDSPDNDVVLGGGKTNKFKLTLKPGGTVEWHFRCQFSKPDEECVPALMRILNQVVPISLECADEEEKLDNFEQAELAGQEPMSAARMDAESLFSKPVAGNDFGEIAATTVDATESEPEQAASNVQPIKGKRGTKRAAGGANLE